MQTMMKFSESRGEKQRSNPGRKLRARAEILRFVMHLPVSAVRLERDTEISKHSS